MLDSLERRMRVKQDVVDAGHGRSAYCPEQHSFGMAELPQPSSPAARASSRRRLVVERVENRGVPHLVGRLLAPGYVAGRLVRVARVLLRIVPSRHEIDPAAGGKSHGRPVEV